MPARLAVLAALSAAPFVRAAGDPPPRPDSEVLAALLRAQLLEHLPAPLHASDRDWGRQQEVTVGVQLRRAGRLRVAADPRKEFRNDGHWQRLAVHAVDPDRTLTLAVRDVRYPEPGRITFEAAAGLDVRVAADRQVWKAGVRLWAGHTVARCRATVRLAAELTDRLDHKPGAVLPDAVLRVRVTAAEVGYSDLVCEQAAGLRGEAARVAGEVAHAVVRRVKPSLERDLLARANAAVVRAADTKEVRVEFDRLLAGKAPGVTRAAGP